MPTLPDPSRDVRGDLEEIGRDAGRAIAEALRPRYRDDHDGKLKIRLADCEDPILIVEAAMAQEIAKRMLLNYELLALEAQRIAVNWKIANDNLRRDLSDDSSDD